MRLDKYLATVGLGTRSEVKKLLRKKSVSVDGEVITDGKFQLDPAISQVMVGQKVLIYQSELYFHSISHNSTLLHFPLRIE